MARKVMMGALWALGRTLTLGGHRQTGGPPLCPRPSSSPFNNTVLPLPSSELIVAS